MDFVGFFAGCVGGRFCNSLVLSMIDNHNFIYCHNLGHQSFTKLVAVSNVEGKVGNAKYETKFWG